MQTWWQYCIPQHLISRLAGLITDCSVKWFKNYLIKLCISHYRVDMADCVETDYKQYTTFNAFFTRHLRQDARPLAGDESTIISPVDGNISELGVIEEARLLQAKGHQYTLQKLLAEHHINPEGLVDQFKNGCFFTAYLAPKDYHRVHMPFSGRLLEMIYVPGRLFSVNELSVKKIPNVFARNERVICIFDTAIGKMAVILVGALIVGSIVTAWHGEVAPSNTRNVQRWQYGDRPVQLNRGDELGYFQMGSTVIVLFQADAMHWLSELKAGDEIRLGQRIAD